MASTAPSATNAMADRSGRAGTTALPIPSLLSLGRSITATAASSRPGDLLALTGSRGETHFGIVADAMAMIAPDPNGLGTMMAIDWDRVRSVRRLG